MSFSRFEITHDEPAHVYGVHVRRSDMPFWMAHYSPSDLDRRLLYNFDSAEAANHFVERLKFNESALNDLYQGKPVVVAGMTYTSHGHYYYAEPVNDRFSTMAVINQWEIERYLSTGDLTPELFANAVERPENFSKLDMFDRQAMLNFVDFARNFPDLQPYHDLENAYWRTQPMANVAHSGNVRNFTIADLTPDVERFMANPVFPPMSPDAGPQMPVYGPHYQRAFADPGLHAAGYTLYLLSIDPAIKSHNEIMKESDLPLTVRENYGRSIVRNRSDIADAYAHVSMLIQEAVETLPKDSEELRCMQKILNTTILPDSPNNHLAEIRDMLDKAVSPSQAPIPPRPTHS